MCLFGKFFIVTTENFYEINLYKFIPISWIRVDDYPSNKIIKRFDPVRCPLNVSNTLAKHFHNQKCILGDETWYYLTNDDLEYIEEQINMWTVGECGADDCGCAPVSYVSYRYIEETAQRWIDRRISLSQDEFYTYFNMDANADIIYKLITLPNADMKLINIENDSLEWFDRRSYKNGDFLLVSTINNSPGIKILRRTSTAVHNIHYWYETYKDRISQINCYDDEEQQTPISDTVSQTNNCNSNSNDLLHCAQSLEEFYSHTD